MLITVPANANGYAFEAAVERGIAHKLGRLPIGWRVVDQDAAASFHRSDDFDTQYLYLTSDGTVTNVKLVVF